MALTLLRHTRPEVASGVCYGRSDLALAESFEAEVEQILQSLPEVSAIVSSPLSRCLQLAERISAHVLREVSISTNWIEMDFGTWEEVPWEQIPRSELDGWAADFHGYRAHGGESVSQLLERVKQGLEGLTPGTLVVTHAGCIKAALVARGDAEGWQARPGFGELLPLPPSQ